MTSKKQWVKSTNGPDLTDVLMMVTALENIHDCRVELTATTAGQGHNGCGVLSATAYFNVLPGSTMHPEIRVDSTYPSVQGKSTWGMFYDLVWRLDFAVSEAYQQRTLTE
jgi:hypothetical protein